MHLQQVASTYRSLRAYYSVFHPLMLHELWESVTEGVNERGAKSWEMVMLPEAQDRPMEGHPHFVLVKCQALNHQQPRIADLMSITYTPLKGPSTCFFATVEKGTSVEKITPNTHMDSRLLGLKKPSQTVLLTVNLRVREKMRPRDEDRKYIMHMQKVSSLHTFLRHAKQHDLLVLCQHQLFGVL